MTKKEVAEWAIQPKIREILVSFSTYKTPRQVEIELGKEFKVKPFLENGFLEVMNPKTSQGIFYVLTDKARKLLGLPSFKIADDKNWGLIGWIMQSPKRRLVVLRTMALNPVKKTSEKIRAKASKYNECLSRPSTKTILKELLSKELVETELYKLKRYYWISEKGKAAINDITELGLFTINSATEFSFDK